MITTIMLVVVLIDPRGNRVETRQDMPSRAECRAQEALARAAMIEAPHGYTLVSAKCEVSQP